MSQSRLVQAGTGESCQRPGIPGKVLKGRRCSLGKTEDESIKRSLLAVIAKPQSQGWRAEGRRRSRGELEPRAEGRGAANIARPDSWTQRDHEKARVSDRCSL